MVRRFFLATCLGLGVFGLFLVLLKADDPPPPPGNPGLPAPGGEEEGEVYNRGPIHEAFAIPGSNDPVQGMVIQKEPPEDIDEIPPDEEPDGDNIVWVPGYWSFDPDLDDFLWISGVWRDVPPGRTWVPGYWTPVEGGYQWVSGNWADENVAEIEYYPEPPKSQELGPSSPSPGDDYFWVPGSWVYQGGYRWRPGYWAVHQENWVWIPARYTWTPFGFIYTPGYWDLLPTYRGLAFAPVYFRHRRHVHYTPVVAIDSWSNVSLSLFVGPSRGFYYYGDYYGPSYVTVGYVPFFEYHRHHHCYDPYFAYNRWRFGNTYSVRLAGWHRYYHDHSDFRPRRTFRGQKEFVAKHKGNEAVALAMVSADLNTVVRSKKLPVGFRKVSKEQKENLVKQTRQLREFTRDRVAEEKKDAAKGDKKGNKGENAVRKGFRLKGNDKLNLVSTQVLSQNDKAGDDKRSGDKKPAKKKVGDQNTGDNSQTDGDSGKRKGRRFSLPDSPDKLKNKGTADGASGGGNKGRKRGAGNADTNLNIPDLPNAAGDSGNANQGKGTKQKTGTFVPRGGKKMNKSDNSSKSNSDSGNNNSENSTKKKFQKKSGSGDSSSQSNPNTSPNTNKGRIQPKKGARGSQSGDSSNNETSQDSKSDSSSKSKSKKSKGSSGKKKKKGQSD